MRGAYSIARDYVCPKCKSSIGEGCRMPSGRKAKYPHRKRVRLLTKDEWDQCAINVSN